jgi:hypothetical protein
LRDILDCGLSRVSEQIWRSIFCDEARTIRWSYLSTGTEHRSQDPGAPPPLGANLIVCFQPWHENESDRFSSEIPTDFGDKA